MECSCGDRKEFGIPCRHILAAATTFPEVLGTRHLNELCDPGFLLSSYQATWAHGLAVPDFTKIVPDARIQPPALNDAYKKRAAAAESRLEAKKVGNGNQCYEENITTVADRYGARAMAALAPADDGARERDAGDNRGEGDEGSRHAADMAGYPRAWP
jgi:hypothetical protein